MKQHCMLFINACLVTQYYHSKRVKKHAFWLRKCTSGESYWSCSIFYLSKMLKSGCFNLCELFKPPAAIRCCSQWYGSNAME
eukprot:UN12660